MPARARELALTALLVAAACFTDEQIITGTDGSSTASATAASTTSERPADPQSLCDAICAKEAECGDASTDCVSQCLNSISLLAANSPPCLAAYADYIGCYAEVPCDEITSMTCASEYTGTMFTCGFCQDMVTQIPTCSVTFACPNDPVTITCDATACTCTANGMSAGGCPAADLCGLDATERRDFALTCCTF